MTPTSTHAPDRRRAIVDLLTRANEPQTITEIAESLGVHGNTVRFHLDALTSDGLVERVDRVSEGPGRPAAAYRAVQRMDPAGPRNYQMLAGVLASIIDTLPNTEAAAVRAGREWGARAVTPIDDRDEEGEQPEIGQLMDLLDDMGFEPRTGGAESPSIELRHCPFLEIADEHRDVICPVHLGLMQGALSKLEAPSTVDRLDPFVQPDRCVAHLRQLPV